MVAGGLRNLGPRSREMLASIGIRDESELRRRGALQVFAELRRTRTGVSLNLLWALVGALEDCDWRIVAREQRLSLLLALEALEQSPRAPGD